MSATPRDLLKPRQQRVSEVYSLLQYQSGQANSQFVTFGCALAVGGTTTQFQVSAGEYVLAQSVVSFAANAGTAVAAGAALTAGQSVFVLVEADSAGVLYQTVGAIVSSGTPVLPVPTVTRIELGYLTLTGVFTPGTTVLTAAMLVNMAYSAGNVSPAGGY